MTIRELSSLENYEDHQVKQADNINTPAHQHTGTSRDQIIAEFDPNGQGFAGHLFGLPFTPENASLVIMPVPWEVTVSYHSGTARGPQAIVEASSQVDLAVKDIPDAWKLGISMLPFPHAMYQESVRLREWASQHVVTSDKTNPPDLKKINDACENLNLHIKSATEKLLKEGKMVALLGGDHSTPLGFLQTLSEEYEDYGILQLDAHCDLRRAYQGFTYSHASIMYNALKLPSVSKLVQAGIRDYCDEELELIQHSGRRVETFFDEDIKAQLFEGKSWSIVCEQIIHALPQNVYISFDIDGLNPKLCPNTGTPVPGGLEFEQATYLIKKLATSGK
ncbi:MAG: agmatinase family protein, partial [Cyclobacteriaceae bacterium]